MSIDEMTRARVERERLADQQNVALGIEYKRQVLDVITTLRNYGLIGIVEARNWIEFLFPEFAEFRDRESDSLFDQLARLSAGNDATGDNEQ